MNDLSFLTEIMAFVRRPVLGLVRTPLHTTSTGWRLQYLLMDAFFNSGIGAYINVIAYELVVLASTSFISGSANIRLMFSGPALHPNDVRSSLTIWGPCFRLIPL